MFIMLKPFCETTFSMRVSRMNFLYEDTVAMDCNWNPFDFFILLVNFHKHVLQKSNHGDVHKAFEVFRWDFWRMFFTIWFVQWTFFAVIFVEQLTKLPHIPNRYFLLISELHFYSKRMLHQRGLFFCRFCSVLKDLLSSFSRFSSSHLNWMRSIAKYTFTELLKIVI